MHYIEKYFTKKECKKIIDLSIIYKKFGFKYDWYKNTYDETNRKQKGSSKFQAYLIPNVEYTKWIFDKLQFFFENKTGIKFIKPLTHCQLYKYSEGDAFQKHIDLVDEFPKRRWNLGINLNDDFEGGEYFCWDNDIEDDTLKIIPKTTGTTCIYHSRQLHEIKTITKGNRWSMVIKVESDFINEEQKFI